MATLPQPRHSLISSIFAWRESQADNGFRPHLGASLIGHPCARYLWLTFRFAKKSTFDGRMLRLFERGQNEEAVMVRELRGLGAEVSECQDDGTQWRVSACGGHFGGSMDGIARKLPGGSDTQWEVLEFKTHNAKSFKELANKGVERSKYQHWAQMQTYMALTGMSRANYLAVCKDDDNLYHERVHADPAAGQRLLDRAESIIFAAEPPPGISQDPAWYQCKACPMHGLCHGTEAPAPTCRSCAHVTPEKNGTWSCAHHGLALDLAQQERGCEAHRYIPATLAAFAEFDDASEQGNWVRYVLKETEKPFTNGTPPAGHDSAEIYAAADKRCLTDGLFSALREHYEGRITA